MKQSNRKIMYQYDHVRNQQIYMIPNNFSDLKLLVNVGYCVKNRNDISIIDIKSYLDDTDLYIRFDASEIVPSNWRGIPPLIDFEDAMKQLKRQEYVDSDGIFLLDEDDLNDLFDKCVEIISREIPSLFDYQFLD